MKSFFLKPLFFHLLILIWCLTLSILGYSNFSQIQATSTALASNAHNVQLNVLQNRITELSEQISRIDADLLTIQQQETQYVNTGTQIQKSLVEIKQQISQFVHRDDFSTLSRKIGELEAEIQKLQTTPARAVTSALALSEAQAHATKPAQRPNAVLPFKVLAREMRGNELYLAIIPKGKSSLDSVSLVSIGQKIGSWTLHSIEEQNAIFKNGAQTRKLSIPE